jgi:hypothetical protein
MILQHLGDIWVIGILGLLGMISMISIAFGKIQTLTSFSLLND